MARYTIDSPEVAALLAGTYRCSPQSYFRIADDGRCFTFPVRRHLMELGINQKSATELMQQADIPYAEFVRNKVEKPVATGNEIPKKTRRLTVRIPLEEDEEDTVEAPIPKNCRYHLIKQGDYHGCFGMGKTVDSCCSRHLPKLRNLSMGYYTTGKASKSSTVENQTIRININNQYERRNQRSSRIDSR
jgi:hypothetical protein